MATKFKSNLTLKSFRDFPKIRCIIELTNHFLKISIIEKISNFQIELIKGLFSPMNHLKSIEYFINYSFINSILYSSELKNNISLEITNPVISNTFIILLSDFESISFIFKKKINVNQIINNIKKKIKEETKFLLYGFNNLIFALRDFLEKEKKYKILDNAKEQSYKYGKKYYEDSALTFKKNTKIIKNISDVVLVTKLKEIEMSLPQQEKIKKNICYTSFESLLGEFNVRTTYFIEETIIVFLKIMCIGINSFDDIYFNKFNLNEIFDNHEEYNNINYIKKKNNSFTSGTNKNMKNNDIFNKINKNNYISNENKIINKTEDSSTEGTSKKKKKQNNNYISQDDTKIQTPKFKQFTNNPNLKNFTNNYYYKGLNNNSQININPLENIMNITQIIINKKITSLNGLNKEIEELCQIHSLVTPNDIFNLFCNASEIIHRKFFQITINNYLGNIFYIEEDKDGVIKIEDLYNYFLYIRALKLMLFNNENKENYVSKILIEDML